MSPHREYWTRLRRQLWQPPRAHGEQPRERVVGPLELFYDLGAAALAGRAFLPAGVRVLAWGLTGVTYLAAFTVMIATATPVQAAALSITDALLERFGLLIIIVLGETVTGVVDGLAHTPVNGLTLLVALVAVVAGFGAWWTYFDFAGHRPPRPERPPTLVWILTHLPLTAPV